jgi:hypothetical protein
LQDLLGAHQDACVATTRLRNYANTVSVRKSERGLLLALGQLIHSQEQHATTQRKRFHDDWRRLKKGLSRKKARAALAIVEQSRQAA